MPATTAASVLRSLTTIKRLGNGLALEARLLIEDLFSEITAEIARIDPTGPAAERWRRERVAKLEDAVRHLTDEAYTDLYRRTRQGLADIGAGQSRYAADLLERSISARAAELGHRSLSAVGVKILPGAIGKNMVKAIIDADPIDGLSLHDWFAGQQANTAQRVMRQVRLGMVQSETTDDIVRRIRGRSAGTARGADGKALRTKAGGFVHRYAGGAMDTTTREAETVARTATQYIANRCHVDTYSANSDVVEGVRYVGTLDHRACEICMAHDSKEWPLGSSEIQTPPLHPNCRSVLSPIVAWERMGLTPPPRATRASMGGQVSAEMDYDAWLRTQPESFRREILGPGRLKLFEDGMHLRDMIRTDNTVMTIAELERVAR
jgi:SPP1 gp7 family putative phage head morphogenesis protein